MNSTELDYLPGYREVLAILNDALLSAFIKKELRESLGSIGFTTRFVDSLVENIEGLDAQSFFKVFKSELEFTYRRGFFQKIVPEYFAEFVIPFILAPHREPKRILDIGCGTGILDLP